MRFGVLGQGQRHPPSPIPHFIIFLPSKVIHGPRPSSFPNPWRPALICPEFDRGQEGKREDEDQLGFGSLGDPPVLHAPSNP